MQNVRKHRDIKLVTADKRRSQLSSEPTQHTPKWFSKNLMGIIKMNKPVFLGMLILNISKTDILISQGFIQAILISVIQHKNLSLTTEFCNSISIFVCLFVSFYFCIKLLSYWNSFAVAFLAIFTQIIYIAYLNMQKMKI